MKNTFKLITYNFKTLFFFELLYKLIISVIFTPLSVFIFNLTVGLIPVYKTIRKRPAEILARTDI